MNLSDNSYDDNQMIAQMLVQMPSIYENKVDHIKHQIDSGNEITSVEVLGHLRDKYMSLKKETVLTQEPQVTPQPFLPSNSKDTVENVESMATRKLIVLN